MRKKMEKLVKQLNGQVLYFTENPINYDDSWYPCKYFLCFQNSHKIYKGFRTQAECIEELEEILNDGTVI